MMWGRRPRRPDNGRMRRLALALVLIASPRVFACSCITSGESVSLAQIKTQYPIVFSGVVESIDDSDIKRIRSLSREEQIAAFSHNQPALHVTFRTMQVWRSDTAVTNRFVVDTGQGGGDCGYPFHEGQSYLVFARRISDGRVTTSICSATVSLICAWDRIEELGPADKTYETIDRQHLIAREDPYTPYWMDCVKPAALNGERNLTMNKH